MDVIIYNIFDSNLQVSLMMLLEVLIATFIMGVFMSLIYIFTNRNGDCSRGLAITLVVLPVVISIVIFLVQDNWARAFSLAGAFSIIRFRSTHGNPRDLAPIFTTLAVGLACGTGYIFVGVVLVIFVAIILVLIHFGEPKKERMLLSITVPEDLNYVGVFEESFKKYTVKHKLAKVKSSNFGTMFVLTFDIVIKKDVNQKEFLDDLRCQNGNLNIVLRDYVYNPEILE